jgi:hypothetical protein
MIDSQCSGADANNSDRVVSGGNTNPFASRPSIDVNASCATGSVPAQPARCLRNRKGKRSERDRGAPVLVELRDGTRIAATLVDASASGLGIMVADPSLVAVRQRGVRATAEIRNVQHEADQCRLALKLLLA